MEQMPASATQERLILSYLSPEEKHRLVGSFVVENFWDTFIEENSDPIDKFRQLAKESIPDFIKAYQDVWDYVIEVNQLDDEFVYESIRKSTTFEGLSPEELKLANKLLGLSLYSELEKDCLMALNKTILGELAEDMRAKYNLSDDEYQLLMTPSFETFFTKYHFDHFEYATTEDSELKQTQQEALIRNFHANDPALFELRFADMNFPTGDNLSAVLAMQKAALADRAAKKVAFIDGRDDFVAFEKLLEYDNFLDFEYRYNLEACPEYYLRKMLFTECRKAGILTEVEKPLELQDTDFISGVNELIKLREQKYIIGLEVGDEETVGIASAGIKEVPIEPSREEIIKHLKQGSPCLLYTADEAAPNSQSCKMIIVGYDNDTLLARIDGEGVVAIDSTTVDDAEGAVVFQKHDQEFIEGVNNATDKFIERKPYLDRSTYEHAF